MSEIKHWVQVVDGEVVHCWDFPPPQGVGVDGWREAVEVKPPIHENRQGYTAHRFDISTDPVEIVYDVFDIGVGDRKSSLKSQAKAAFNAKANRHIQSPDDFDADLLTDYNNKIKARTAAIDACQTHDDLDALSGFTEQDLDR
jgi:hypothetical protein